MNRRALTSGERCRIGGGGFGPRYGGGRNDPRTRAAFDAWLERTRPEREALEQP